jgi:hypothetical protein
MIPSAGRRREPHILDFAYTAVGAVVSWYSTPRDGVAAPEDARRGVGDRASDPAAAALRLAQPDLLQTPAYGSWHDSASPTCGREQFHKCERMLTDLVAWPIIIDAARFRQAVSGGVETWASLLSHRIASVVEHHGNAHSSRPIVPRALESPCREVCLASRVFRSYGTPTRGAVRRRVMGGERGAGREGAVVLRRSERLRPGCERRNSSGSALFPRACIGYDHYRGRNT